MFQFFKDMVKYDIVCRRRGHHEPLDEDLQDFLSNMKFTKNTICQDCKIGFKIEQDEEDDSFYYIDEL